MKLDCVIYDRSAIYIAHDHFFELIGNHWIIEIDHIKLAIVMKSEHHLYKEPDLGLFAHMRLQHSKD